MSIHSMGPEAQAAAKAGLLLIVIGMTIGATGMSLTGNASRQLIVLLGTLACVGGFAIALFGRLVR